MCLSLALLVRSPLPHAAQAALPWWWSGTVSGQACSCGLCEAPGPGRAQAGEGLSGCSCLWFPGSQLLLVPDDFGAQPSLQYQFAGFSALLGSC